MTLNWIGWWSSSSGSLGSVESFSFPLLPGSLWTWVIVTVRVSSMSQIDAFKNYLYLIKIFMSHTCIQIIYNKNSYLKLELFTKNYNKTCKIILGIVNKKHSWVSYPCLFIPNSPSGLTAGSSWCYIEDYSSPVFHTLHLPHLIYESLLQIQTLSNTEMFGCPDFSSGSSWGGGDIATVDRVTSTSWKDCRSGVDITTVDFWTGGFSGISVSGVWIETWDAVSGCGGNLDSIYSGLGCHWPRTEVSPHVVLMTSNNSSIFKFYLER